MIFPPFLSIKESIYVKDEEMDFDFIYSKPDFNVLCNVVSILPAQYDVISEVEENEEEFDTENMANHKSVFYYVMNNGWVEEQEG